VIDPKLSRRALLQRAGLTGGALFLSSAFPFPRAARAAAASQTPVSLSEAEWKSLDAVTARLIPTDHEPGAREAGCVNFIDKALANEEAAALPLYRGGLAALAVCVQASEVPTFEALEPAAQDELLRSVELGSATAWPAQAPPSPMFFEVVRAHTLIGFLAEPKYGGNGDFAGWRVAGYPGPRHVQGGYTPEQMNGTAPIRMPWDDETK